MSDAETVAAVAGVLIQLAFLLGGYLGARAAFDAADREIEELRGKRGRQCRRRDPLSEELLD